MQCFPHINFSFFLLVTSTWLSRLLALVFRQPGLLLTNTIIVSSFVKEMRLVNADFVNDLRSADVLIYLGQFHIFRIITRSYFVFVIITSNALCINATVSLLFLQLNEQINKLWSILIGFSRKLLKRPPYLGLWHIQANRQNGTRKARRRRFRDHK